jgi:hypothetical protein
MTNGSAVINSNAAILVDGSLLTCDKTFTVPDTAAMILTAVLTSINTLVIVTTTLFNSSIEVVNSTVIVMSFGAALSSRVTGMLGTTASATNTTSIVCTSDVKSLANKFVPKDFIKFASVELVAFFAVPPTRHEHVSITVNGCGLFLVPSATTANQATIDRDVSAMFLPPASMNLSIVRIVVSALSSVTSGMIGGRGISEEPILIVLHPVAVAGLGDANISQTNVTIEADALTTTTDQDPPVSLTGLMESRWGTLRIEGGVYIVQGGLMFAALPPWRVNVVVGFGTVNSEPSYVVLGPDVSIDISGVVFVGFLSVVSSSTIVTTTLSSDDRFAKLPRFLLGCNAWDGTAMTNANVGSVVPLSLITSSLHRSRAAGSNRKVCRGLGAVSMTATLPPPTVPELPDATLQQRQAVVSIVIFGVLAVSQGSAGGGGSRGGAPAVFGAFAVLQMRRRCAFQQLQEQSAGLMSGNSSGGGGDHYPESCGPMDNVLQLTYISSSIPDSLQCAVGTVIGNVVIAVAIALLAHGGSRYGAPYLKRSLFTREQHDIVESVEQPSTQKSETKRSRANSVHPAIVAQHLLRNILLFFCTTFPGSLALPFAIVGVPTLATSAMLIGRRDSTPALMVLGIVVFMMCVGFSIGVVWNVLLRVRPFPLTSRFLRAPSRTAAPSMMSWLVHPVAEWQSTKGLLPSCTGARSEHLINFWPYFEGLRGRREWFFSVDFTCLLLTGSLVGASYAAPDSASCDALVWAGSCVALVAVLQVVLCGALRPFATPIDNIACGLVTSIAFASEVISLTADDSDDATADAASTLALIGTIVQLLPAVITTVYGWKWKLLRTAEASGLHPVVARSDATKIGASCRRGGSRRMSRQQQQQHAHIVLSRDTIDALATLVQAICCNRTYGDQEHNS